MIWLYYFLRCVMCMVGGALGCISNMGSFSWLSRIPLELIVQSDSHAATGNFLEKKVDSIFPFSVAFLVKVS